MYLLSIELAIACNALRTQRLKLATHSRTTRRGFSTEFDATWMSACFWKALFSSSQNGHTNEWNVYGMQMLRSTVINAIKMFMLLIWYQWFVVHWDGIDYQHLIVSYSVMRIGEMRKKRSLIHVSNFMFRVWFNIVQSISDPKCWRRQTLNPTNKRIQILFDIRNRMACPQAKLTAGDIVALPTAIIDPECACQYNPIYNLSATFTIISVRCVQCQWNLIRSTEHSPTLITKRFIQTASICVRFDLDATIFCRYGFHMFACVCSVVANRFDAKLLAIW